METPTSTITTTGDLGGRKVPMSFDENSLAHLMSVLTDLYSDPEAAVIREYSTNALDAHIEAGNTAPIEVTTPSPLSPYFKVRDYGVGLSVDDIVDMYSKYGASTKRGTNTQVGMLGLGAKSALSLVPQFNLTSVKNGVKIFVSVSRASDGSGQMEIIDTKATTESNGVEISIPVPRTGGFQDKCNHFFKFWGPGTVLVNGQEPKHISGRVVSDKILIDSSLNQDYIVMGNVAYPVKNGLYGGWTRLGIVASVDIGDVNFTPSREELHYTPKTNQTINQIKADLLDNLKAAADKEISAAPGFQEAWDLAHEWRKTFNTVFNNHVLTYKDQVVPNSIPVTGKWKSVDIHAYRSSRYSSYLGGIEYNTHKTFLFIIGFSDSLKVSAPQRERIKKYLEQNGLSLNKAVVTHDGIVPDIDWTKNIHKVDWKVIAAIKIDRAASTRAVKTDPYDLYTGDYWPKSVPTLDTTKEIIFLSPTEDKHPTFLREIYPDAQIVIIGMNRWDKFKRDFPGAMHYRDRLNKDREDLAKGLTESDKILWHYYNDYRYSFAGLDPAKVDDPDLKKFIEVMSGGQKYSDAGKKAIAFHQARGGVMVDRPDNPLTKYPLGGRLSTTDKDHIYWYLNSWYHHINNKENNNVTSV